MSTANTTGFDGGRQFSCSYCQRTFRRLEHLQRHTRRHTNEKPFACPCGAQFSRRDLLRRHERVARHQELDTFLTQNSEDGQPVLDGDHSMIITLGPRNDDRERQEQTRVPHSSCSSGNPNQSVRTVSVPLGGHHTSPPLEQAPHRAEGNDERPQSETNTWRLTIQGLPVVFPCPQLTLASQIVPHFASPIVTVADRSRLLISLKRIHETFPNPNLPSTNTLSRFIAGYFTGFYPRLPFTHAPTFKLGSCSPELCLAMMAVGAMERFEYKTATELFYLAKTLLFNSQQQPIGKAKLIASNTETRPPRSLLDELRCLICLCQIASWQNHSSLKNEAFILQSLLGQSLRLSGLEEPKQSLQHLEWTQWSRQESERRTKLLAFCLLGIHSIAYDVTPSIWCEEINLRLPCSCPEWTAPDATTWNLLHQATLKEQGRFHDTLEKLLYPVSEFDDPTLTPTPVGNYVLMHGLLQKVVWAGRVISSNLGRTSLEKHRSTLELALQKWTTFWQNTPESDLEPLGPNGPLPFTSTALLSLAYVRNCSDVFRSRNILTWAPAEISQELRTFPPIDRNWRSLLAAYHATNFLATLVNLGVQYFKCNQAVLWSIEATLCGLECSVFLEKWLRGVQDTMQIVPLTDSELRLVDWITEVVLEGLSSVDESPFDAITETSISPDQIILLWSHILQGNSPMPFINMVGQVIVDYGRLAIEGS